MPAPKKYPDELRERATRLAVEARRDPAGAVGAIRRIADQLGIHPEALRVWVKQAETDAGVRPGTTSSDEGRIAALGVRRVRPGRVLPHDRRLAGRHQPLHRPGPRRAEDGDLASSESRR